MVVAMIKMVERIPNITVRAVMPRVTPKNSPISVHCSVSKLYTNKFNLQVYSTAILITCHEYNLYSVPILKLPSTAAVNVTVVPVAMKQNSDSVCASGGIETVTVSEMKLSVLFSASDVMVDDRQL